MFTNEAGILAAAAILAAEQPRAAASEPRSISPAMEAALRGLAPTPVERLVAVLSEMAERGLIPAELVPAPKPRG